MDEIKAFLDMGGYAAFVWPCYGLVAAVMIGLYLQSRRALANEEAALRALQATVAPTRRESANGDEA